MHGVDCIPVMDQIIFHISKKENGVIFSFLSLSFIIRALETTVVSDWLHSMCHGLSCLTRQVISPQLHMVQTVNCSLPRFVVVPMCPMSQCSQEVLEAKRCSTALMKDERRAPDSVFSTKANIWCCNKGEEVAYM